MDLHLESPMGYALVIMVRPKFLRGRIGIRADIAQVSQRVQDGSDLILTDQKIEVSDGPLHVAAIGKLPKRTALEDHWAKTLPIQPGQNPTLFEGPEARLTGEKAEGRARLFSDLGTEPSFSVETRQTRQNQAGYAVGHGYRHQRGECTFALEPIQERRGRVRAFPLTKGHAKLGRRGEPRPSERIGAAGLSQVDRYRYHSWWDGFRHRKTTRDWKYPDESNGSSVTDSTRSILLSGGPRFPRKFF
jgi:hypothetical protein